jgi:hypothetical protein
MLLATEQPVPASNTLALGTTEFRTRRTVSDEVDILEYWVE